jgi:hypothetical protein
VFVIGRSSLIQRFYRMSAFPGFGVHVLFMQKILKKLQGAFILFRFKDLSTRHMAGGHPSHYFPIASLVFIHAKRLETFEKCSISFKFKEGENFNHRNTLSISRIKI